MAIRLIDRYPGRANPASDEYPQGSVKNKTSLDLNDGTPLEKDWANDKEAFFQGLLMATGVTPSGNTDTVLESDYMDALRLRVIQLVEERVETPSQKIVTVGGILAMEEI